MSNPNDLMKNVRLPPIDQLYHCLLADDILTQTQENFDVVVGLLGMFQDDKNNIKITFFPGYFL
jgi:hypothetical protein